MPLPGLCGLGSDSPPYDLSSAPGNTPEGYVPYVQVSKMFLAEQTNLRVVKWDSLVPRNKANRDAESLAGRAHERACRGLPVKHKTA